MSGPIYIRRSGDAPGVGNPVMVSDTDPMPVKIAGGAGDIVDTELPTAALLAENTATPTAPAVAAFNQVYDGTNWDFLRSATGGGVRAALETAAGTGIDGVTGDSGNTALVVSPARKEVSFTTTTVQAVGSTDISNYHWVAVQVTSQGGSSTATFQISNDNSNWVAVALIPSTNTGTSSPATSTTSTGIWFGAVTARYFRLNVTGIVSGTTAGVIEFFSQGSGINSGSVAVGSILTSITPGTAAANLGKAEDAAHTSGDTGVFALGVRNDAATVLSNADGDYSALATDGSGRMQVVQSGTYTHITTNTTTTAKSGVGILVGIVINTKGLTTNTATVYDNTAGSGTVIAVVDTVTQIGMIPYGCRFATGLTVVTASGTAGDLTVITA